MAQGWQPASLVRFGRRCCVGTVLFYVLASLTLGGTRFARTAFLCSTFAWLIWLSLRGVKHRRQPRVSADGTWRGNLCPITEVVISAFALALAASETALRIWNERSGTSPAVRFSLNAVRLVPGLDYGGGLHGNCLGYPGPEFCVSKPPHVYRIAALGDSHAIGPVVPFAENYLTLLGDKLPHTEVYNFGVSGTGPREYRLVLQQDVWTYQPDLVLVSVFVTNDVTDMLPTPRHLDPRQHALYWFFAGCRPQSDSTPASPGLAEAAFAERLRTGTLSTESFCEVEAQRLQVCLTPTSPGLEKKWRRCFGYLDELIRDCRDRRTPVAFVLVPDQAQADPESCEAVLASGRLDASQIDLEAPQRRFREFFAGRGVPCLDLLPAFAGRSGLYTPRNTHWSIPGNRLAAERIAAWLPSVGLGPVNSPVSSPPTPAP